MEDEAPSYLALARKHLANTLPERWVKLGGSLEPWSTMYFSFLLPESAYGFGVFSFLYDITLYFYAFVIEFVKLEIFFLL